MGNCGQLNKSLNHIHVIPPSLLFYYPFFSEDVTEVILSRLNAPQLVEPMEPIDDTVNISMHPVKVFQNEENLRRNNVICILPASDNKSLELSDSLPSIRNILKISPP